MNNRGIFIYLNLIRSSKISRRDKNRRNGCYKRPGDPSGGPERPWGPSGGPEHPWGPSGGPRNRLVANVCI
jgi:hypothetical protein